MKTVLFYSFKGGVGRTQSLLNIAKYLSKDKKIAIVDFDIYAPGLSYMSSNIKSEDKVYFLQYLVNLFQSNTKKDIFVEKINDNLTLIPAFNMKNIRPYHTLLTDLSQYLYSIKNSSEIEVNAVSTVADNIFNTIKNDIAKTGEYDYLFFDARTGITEVSDILFSQDLDLKVIVSSYNSQNINGTNEILTILPKVKIRKHNILRILSPKPKKERDELEQMKIQASLDDNLDLQSKFEWNGIKEVHYEDEIVITDFDVWDKLSDESVYKQDIIDIANKIENIFEGDIII